MKRAAARVAGIFLTAWYGASPPVALATTCQDVCPGSGTCTIAVGRTVTPGSDLDCSGRDIVLANPLGSLEVNDGLFTLRAANLTIEATRHITATSGASGLPFGLGLVLSGTFDATGFLRANSGTRGGTISVKAVGDIFVRHAEGETLGIRAVGETADDPGGRVRLTSGGAVLIEDEILAENQGVSGNGAGGEIVIRASGDITVNARLSVHGRGTGGAIALTTGGNIDVNEPVVADGGGPSGNGGGIEMAAARIVLNDALIAKGGLGASGGQAAGGSVELQAGAFGITINSGIDVTGGAGGGGSITAESEDDLTVSTGVTLASQSTLNGGNGGSIALHAEDQLTIGQSVTIDASGQTASGGEGSGADIDLDACAVSIPASVTIDASGFHGGTVILAGRQSLTVGATVDASGTDSDGEIELAYRGTCSNVPTRTCGTNAECTVGCSTGQCSQPNTTGAIFIPTPPELNNDRSLVPCL